LYQNENIKCYDYFQDLKSKDDTISQIILQYEDKMRRLKEENEINEKKIFSLNDKAKKLQKELEENIKKSQCELKSFDTSIKEIIAETSDIILQMKNTLEVDLSDDSLQEEVYKKIKEMINVVDNQDKIFTWVNEMKSYLCRSLYAFLDIIFGRIELDKNFTAQKYKWQVTLDQIALSHEEEIKKSNFMNLLRFQIR
jgi:hypothetical protein